MAEINLTATEVFRGGPEVPAKLVAYLADRPWPGGGSVKVLRFLIGSDTIQIWPVVPAEVRRLGQTLLDLAKQLEEGGERGE